jgi:hypothetical protein
MDAIDTFKLQALDTMKTTVDALNTEVARAQDYLARTRQADPQAEGGTLHLPDQPA